jgi:hypothetical protein
VTAMKKHEPVSGNSGTGSVALRMAYKAIMKSREKARAKAAQRRAARAASTK